MFLFRTRSFCLSVFSLPNQLLQKRLLGFRGIADSHGQLLRCSCIIEPLKGNFPVGTAGRNSSAGSDTVAGDVGGEEMSFS